MWEAAVNPHSSHEISERKRSLLLLTLQTIDNRSLFPYMLSTYPACFDWLMATVEPPAQRRICCFENTFLLLPLTTEL